jgi:ribosomal protein S18 acetylase RimI-like enzyme
MTASIRSARPGDRDALYAICLRTGAAGGDASGEFDDPRLLGHVFVGPYLELSPGLAFVLEDDAGHAAGYVLGALDTPAFVAAFRERWSPRFADVRPPEASGDRRDHQALEWLRDPGSLLDHRFPGHPSHLHIDLLPHVQGRGHGRSLIETACDALRGAGSPGVHLGVDRGNQRALGFYPRVGFVPLQATRDAVFFGRALA